MESGLSIGGCLQILVNSDKNIAVDTRVISYVYKEANHALSRYENRLTRLEFHLSDVNSHKFGALDKRCMVEARPAGGRPLAATMSAANVPSAVRGSLSKLRSALETYFARSARSSGRTVTNASAQPRKKAAASASKSVKKLVAKKTASKQAAATGRSPEKKAIYQARRKSWPQRTFTAGG
jgi:hypothetical protein